jgi:hypothetical protein
VRIGYSGRATPAASLEEIALPKIANVPDRPREELREHHRLPPEEGVIALRTIVSVLRRLGADSPALVQIPFAGSPDAQEGWARRLRERTLAAVSDRVVSRL